LDSAQTKERSNQINDSSKTGGELGETLKTGKNNRLKGSSKTGGNLKTGGELGEILKVGKNKRVRELVNLI